MFQSIERPVRFNIPLVFLHAFVAVGVPTMIALIIDSHIAFGGPAQRLLENAAWFCGLPLGFLIQSLVPIGRREARWTWVPGAMLFTVLFVLDSIDKGPSQAWKEFILEWFVQGDSAADTGILVAFVTLPAWTCISYALGAKLASVTLRRAELRPR